MKIKKGDWFRCIKSTHSHRKSFIEGSYYKSEADGCITCENGNRTHSITGDRFKSEHFVKLYTIQDVKDGKVAIYNDGTINELNTVMGLCFDIVVCGSNRFYYESGGWACSNEVAMPSQSVKDFIVQLPKEEPKTPDLSDEAINKKEERLTTEAIDWLDGTSRIELPKFGVAFMAKETKPWPPTDVLRKLSDHIGKLAEDAKNKEWQPKVGEAIEADIFDNGEFVKAEYLATDHKCPKWKHSVSFVCCHSGEREVENATKIRPIPQTHKVTKQEIADHLGIPVEQLEIVE